MMEYRADDFDMRFEDRNTIDLMTHFLSKAIGDFWEHETGDRDQEDGLFLAIIVPAEHHALKKLGYPVHMETGKTAEEIFGETEV
jgi:hypothetical protein